jgi:hypothetical protein
VQAVATRVVYTPLFGEHSGAWCTYVRVCGRYSACQIFDMVDEKSREKCLKEIKLVQVG